MDLYLGVGYIHNRNMEKRGKNFKKQIDKPF